MTPAIPLKPHVMYCIHPKYWDTIPPKTSTSILPPVDAHEKASSVDPDQTPRSAASNQGATLFAQTSMPEYLE